MVGRPLRSCDVRLPAVLHRASSALRVVSAWAVRRAEGAHLADRRLLVVKPWLKYSIVRLGLFAVVLGLLLVLRFDPFWATLIAAVVGFCVSYLFFATLRRKVALDLADRRSRPAKLDDDSVAEDEAIADDDVDRARRTDGRA
jgi:hypothetical protein